MYHTHWLVKICPYNRGKYENERFIRRLSRVERENSGDIVSIRDNGKEMLYNSDGLIDGLMQERRNSSALAVDMQITFRKWLQLLQPT